MEVLSPGTVAAFEQEIKESIGKPRYELWFSGNTKLSLEEGGLLVGVPNRFFQDWLERHFADDLRAATERVLGERLPVRFRIDAELFRQSRTKTSPPKTEKPTKPVKLPKRSSRYGLDRFIVGSSNRVAHAAITAVLEDPRHAFSPLYIQGGVGTGKTHLLKGLEEGLKHAHPELKVQAISCEEFTNQFVDAMKTGRLTSFRKKFRQLDVFIVDDLQFLSNKRATQEEFFHTLNALELHGAKVVLAGDCHPRRLSRVGEELKSRFVSGMVAKLEPPNQEMRRRILRDKAARRGLELPRDVLDFLAEKLHANICELEGAVNFLQHYVETMQTELDLATAQTALAEVLRHSSTVLRVSDVKKKACDLFNINSKTLKERSRARAVAHPRMFVLYLARKHTQATYSEIGQQIGGLNHSTVIAAEKKIRAKLDKDGEILLGDRPWKVRDAVETFERELGNGS